MSQLPEGNAGQPQDGSHVQSQQINFRQVSALVPENVARGRFATGAVVIGGLSEIVLDFVMCLSRPHQVVSRVIIAPQFLGQLVHALQDNLQRYEAQHGKIPAPPKPEPGQAKAPPIQDLYEEIKIPDDVVAGVYSNGVMISHSPSDFVFDFISNIYPRSAVSARVFMSAQQVSRMLDTLVLTHQQQQQKQAAAQAAQAAQTPQLTVTPPTPKIEPPKPPEPLG